MTVELASLAKATNTQFATAETHIHQRQIDRTQNGYICYKYTRNCCFMIIPEGSQQLTTVG